MMLLHCAVSLRMGPFFGSSLPPLKAVVKMVSSTVPQLGLDLEHGSQTFCWRVLRPPCRTASLRFGKLFALTRVDMVLTEIRRVDDWLTRFKFRGSQMEKSQRTGKFVCLEGSGLDVLMVKLLTADLFQASFITYLKTSRWPSAGS
ncbi:hypothetical protein SUGI_0180620 [Cryptomeria japonica]|nr:hypothetical protein SUGI_0180620 [Cryptomeria japonica]